MTSFSPQLQGKKRPERHCTFLGNLGEMCRSPPLSHPLRILSSVHHTLHTQTYMLTTVTVATTNTISLFSAVIGRSLIMLEGTTQVSLPLTVWQP